MIIVDGIEVLHGNSISGSVDLTVLVCFLELKVTHGSCTYREVLIMYGGVHLIGVLAVNACQVR